MTKPFDYSVEILAGGLGWVDITDDVRGAVSITRGRSGEGYRADPGKCAFRLDNRTGRYSPRNAASDLYGYIGRNTPVRVHAGPAGGTLVSRFYGEIPSWPPRWSLSGADRYVDLDAAGLLRRFGQGDQPELSAMRRTIAASGPLAYWPIEDGGDATQAASTVAGVPAATVTNAVEFTTVEDLALPTQTLKYGTQKLVNLAAGGTITAALPAGPATAWTVAVTMQVDPLDYAADVVILEWTTPGGTYDRWQIVATKAWTGPEGDWTEQLIAYPASGAAAVRTRISTGVSSGFNLWTASAEQVGGNIATSLIGRAPVSIAGTLAPVATITVNATGTTSTTPMPAGHLVVWPLVQPFDGIVDSALSNVGEGAVARLIRLADEADLTVDTDLADDQHLSRMGAQMPASLPTLLDETIAVDGGMLFEDRDQLALAYRTRSNLYNQTAVTIAYAGQTSPPFDPADDVDDVRNDVTVSRTNGSSARALQTTGPLAALEPPDGVGIYTTSETLNVDTDAALPDQAGWRRHLGTVDEPRYPAITVQLAAPDWIAAPSLRASLLALDVGGVLEVDDPPAWVSGRVRTLVTGYTETIDEFLWSITFNGVPASPWDVAQEAGEQRVAVDGATLAAGVTTTATSLSLSTTGQLFTTNASAFPLDLLVGGAERVTVSAIDRSFLDTFFRTVAAGGWGGSWTISNGTASGFSVNGSEGLVAVSAVNAEQHATIDVGSLTQDMRLWCTLPVTPTGAGINWGVLLRYADASNYLWADAQVGTDSSITVRLIKRLAGVATVYGTLVVPTTHSTTVPRALRAEANGSTFRAKVWDASGAEPGWQITATDTAFPTSTRAGAIARLMTGNTNATPVTLRFDNAAVANPQTATVTARSVNGVVKAWPAGVSVDVYAPAVVPL